MSAGFDELMAEGLAASHRGDVEAALAAWRGAAAERPGSALPHFLAGAELAQAGRIEEAEAAFAHAVLRAPQFETARYQLGLLQFTSGRAAIALLTWEPLLRLDEGHCLRHFVEGFALLARDEFDAALERFRTGMSANHDNAPMNADIAQVVAAIEQHLGRAAAHGEPRAADFHVLLSAYRDRTPLQ